MSRFAIDWHRVAIIAGVLFLIVIIVDFNTRLEELDSLNRQAEITRAEATQVALTQVVLETKIAQADSNQIVEEHARSEERMIQEGDQPVIILGDEGQPPPKNTEPTPIPTQQPNWQLWRGLFFDEE
jgi:cell division protein FtsB